MIDFALRSVVAGLVVKATALMIGALGVHWLLGRRRVLVQSAWWNACCVGLALLPICCASGPWFPLHCLPEAQPGLLAPVEWSGPEVFPSTGPAREDQADEGARERQGPSAASATGNAIANPIRANEPSQSFPWIQQWDGTAILGGIYVIGVSFLWIWLLCSLVAVHRLCRGSQPVQRVEWQQRVAEIRARLGLRQEVEVLVCPCVNVPAVVRWARPAILLPPELAASASAADIDAILLHELAHVKRADFAWNLGFRCLQALYWPHPLVWWIGRIVAEAREQAADAWCVHALGGVENYRQTLLTVATALTRRPEVSLGIAMARRPRLAARLERLAQAEGVKQCLAAGPLRCTLVVAVAAAAGLAGGAELARRAAAGTVEDAGPLGKLDRAAIPVVDRFGWHPKELVGLIGHDAGRAWSQSRAVARTSDPKKIVLADWRSRLRVFDAEAGTQQSVLTNAHGTASTEWNPNYVKWIQSLATTPAKDLFVSGGWGGELHLWRVNVSKLEPAGIIRIQAKVEGNRSIVPDHLAFSSDGRWLACCDAWGRDVWTFERLGNTFEQRSMYSKFERHKIKGERPVPEDQPAVSDLVFCDNPIRLISTVADGSVNLHVPEHLETKTRLHKFSTPAGKLATSRDGHWLAAAEMGGEHAIFLWRGKPFWKMKRVDHGIEIRAGQLKEGNWNSQTIDRLSFPVYALALSRTGRWLVAADFDAQIHVWDLRQNVVKRLSPIRGALCAGPDNLEFENDDILWLRTPDLRRHRWRLSEPPPILPPPETESGIHGLCYLNDGQTLLRFSDQVNLWDLGGRFPALQAATKIPNPAYSVWWRVNARRTIAVFQSGDARDGKLGLHFWKLNDSSASEFAKIEFEAPTYPNEGVSDDYWSAAFSPNDKTLAAGNHRGEIHFWDLAAQPPRKIDSIPTDAMHVFDLDYSPDGRFLAVACASGKCLILDVHDGYKQVTAFRGEREYVRVSRFSPDSQFLVIGDQVGHLWIRRVSDWSEVGEWNDGTGDRVVFFPDGKHFVDAGHLGTIALRNTADGKIVKRWQWEGSVWSLDLHPNGKHLAVGGDGGVTHILRLEGDEGR